MSTTGAFEQDVFAFQWLLLKVFVQLHHVFKDRVWRSGLQIFLAYQENAICFTLCQHIHDILVLQVGIFAQFTHRTKDLRIALEGIDSRLHGGWIGIVRIHNQLVVSGLH